MGLLASDVDLALRRVEMSCVQKIILTKVDAGQVTTRQITNLHLCKVKEHDKGSPFLRFSLRRNVNSNYNKDFCILSDAQSFL